ncbi:hypothetical protein [Kitasatospora sp. NPDC058046]|uniref:hypothetical protein n=1 Tax=Kitasatospora sp. NPDC058046 TaxID=3346312 RepID=UPI0036DB182E
MSPGVKEVTPDYRELYEKVRADLDATRERSDEADELRAEVARLQEQAVRDRIAAEYALPPVLAALVQAARRPPSASRPSSWPPSLYLAGCWARAG